MKTKQHLIPLLIITLTALTLTIASGSLLSGYHFMDCHAFTRYKHEIQASGWLKCLTNCIAAESGARFRPLWHLNTILSVTLWGDNMLMQGLWQILKNIIAASLIYTLGRKLKWKPLESLILAALTMLGTQSAIFYQTLAIESTALVIMLLSWLCMVEYVNRGGGNCKSRTKLTLYTTFLTLSTIMILMKENFILTLPAAYILYCMAYSRKHNLSPKETIKQTIKTATLLTTLTIAALAAVLLFAGHDFGYAGMDTHSSWTTYLKSALYLYAITGTILPIAAAIITYRRSTPAHFIKQWAYPLALFAAITLPQVILYSKSNIIDRYLIPATLGCALITTFAYREIKNKDTTINRTPWKNLSAIAGIITITLCTLITIKQEYTQTLVQAAVNIQGKALREMTTHASRQYLSATIQVMSAATLLAGIFLLLWGCTKRQGSIRISQLYAGAIAILLFLNTGIAFASCRRYAIRGNATEKFLHAILANTHKHDPILIVADPTTLDTEGATLGITTWLNERHRSNLYICPISTDPTSASTTSILDFYHNKDFTALPDTTTLPLLAIFPGQEPAFEALHPRFTTTYNRQEFFGGFIVYTKNHTPQ